MLDQDKPTSSTSPTTGNLLRLLLKLAIDCLLAINLALGVREARYILSMQAEVGRQSAQQEPTVMAKAKKLEWK